MAVNAEGLTAKPLFSQNNSFQGKYDGNGSDTSEDYYRQHNIPYSHAYPPAMQTVDSNLANPKRQEWDAFDHNKHTAIPFVVRLPALLIALIAAGLGGAIIAWIFTRSVH